MSIFYVFGQNVTYFTESHSTVYLSISSYQDPKSSNRIKNVENWQNGGLRYTVVTLYVIIWDSLWRQNEMSKFGLQRHRMTQILHSADFETGGRTTKILTSTTEVF